MVELPIFGDATVTDDPTDGVFESIASSGTVTSQSEVSNFLQRFVTKRALFEFDLTVIPAGATIESATLTMVATKTASGGAGALFDIHGYPADGVVELADAGASDGVVHSFLVDSTGSYTFDLTDTVQSRLGAGSEALGLNIRAQSEGPDPNGHADEVGFSPSESTSQVFPPPEFSVTYTGPPVPGTPFWSHAAALLALLAVSARVLASRAAQRGRTTKPGGR